MRFQEDDLGMSYDLLIDLSSRRFFADWRIPELEMKDALQLLSKQYSSLRAAHVRVIVGDCPQSVRRWAEAISGGSVVDVGRHSTLASLLSTMPELRGSIVLLTGGNLWVEPLVDELVDEHARSDAAISIADFHSGFAPVIGDVQSLAAVSARLDSIQSHLRGRLDEAESGVRQIRRPIPEQNVYMGMELPEGWACVARIARSGKSRGEWRVPREHRDGFILTRENYRRSIRSMGVFRPLEGARILEIGCSPDKEIGPRLLLEEFGARSYTGVNFDPIRFEGGWHDDRAVFHQGDVRDAPLAAGQFDLVFSIAVWEHVRDPRGLFNTIPKWLAPYGGHYGKFQTWTAAHGYHLPPGAFPGRRLPPYAHLTMSPDALRSHLRSTRLDPSQIDDAIRKIYEDPYINRVSAAEFVDLIRSCGLEVVFLDGRTNGRIRPESIRASEAIGRKHSAAELAVEGLEFYLRKSDFRLLDVAKGPV